jgi:ribosomal protein S18 acetylase RimI-like enzyme
VTDEERPPIARPATARPRGAPEGASPASDPPSPAELAAIERGFAALPHYSGAEVGEVAALAAVLVRLPSRGVGYNFCACPRWTEGDVSRRLELVARLMRSQREWPALVAAEGVSQPPILRAALAEAGWFELESERIMWTRQPPGVPHLDPALRLEAVSARSAAEYEQLERAVFGLPAEFAPQRTASLAEAVTGEGLRAYLVRLDGEAVATTRLAVEVGLGCIFGVGVAPAHRRRGLGTLVTAVATRAALAGGSRLVWLSVDERNEPALSVYRRLGFRPAFTWSRWVGPEVGPGVGRSSS